MPPAKHARHAVVPAEDNPPPPSPPPSPPPPSPPPESGSVRRATSTQGTIAVVVCGLARTLNHPIVVSNFHAAIVKPLDPDVFLAITHEKESSRKYLEEEVSDFRNMLIQRGTGYVGWMRSAWPGFSLETRTAEQNATTCPEQTQWEDMHSQWRTVQVGFRMLVAREALRGRPYAAVMRTRTDIIFEQAFPPPDILLKALSPVELLVDYHTARSWNGKRVVGDVVAVMQRNMANAYFDVFQSLECGPNGESKLPERSWYATTRAAQDRRSGPRATSSLLSPCLPERNFCHARLTLHAPFQVRGSRLAHHGRRVLARGPCDATAEMPDDFQGAPRHALVLSYCRGVRRRS